jgi:hypothetical protein
VSHGRRGRRNPTTTTWVFIGGGVALAGVAAYLIFKPSTPPATTTTSTAPRLDLTQTTAPPPSTTYQLAVNGDTSAALKVGETLGFTLPPLSDPTTAWSMAVENQTGQARQVSGSAIVAQVAGVVMVRFMPVNQAGGSVGPGHNVTVSITG